MADSFVQEDRTLEPRKEEERKPLTWKIQFFMGRIHCTAETRGCFT